MWGRIKMRVLHEQSEIVKEFQGKARGGEFLTEATAFLGPELEQDHIAPKISDAEQQINEGQKRAVQLRVGMGDAENLSGGLQGAGSAEAARRRSKNEEKEAKQRLADMQLQALLDQLGAIDAKIDAIDEQISELEAKIDVLNETMEALLRGDIDVAGAMNRPEVAEAIREWEKRNPGRKFDPSSEDAQDIMVAIMSSQTDEWNNDVAALKVDKGVLEVQREGLKTQIDELRGPRSQGATVEILQPKIDAITESANGADVLASEMNADTEIEELARDSQDGLSLKELAEEEDLTAENSFEGFDMGPSDKLVAASDEMSDGFKVAALGTEVDTPGHSPEKGLDFSAKI